MKSMLKIIRRYSVTAGIIILVILISNMLVFFGWGYQVAQKSEKTEYRRGTLSFVSKQLEEKNGAYVMNPEGEKELEDSAYVWAIALDEEGKTVWEWKVPAEIPREYSLQDVAVFSRWYIKDYPVRVWTHGDLLFVYGCNKNAVSRYSEFMDIEEIKAIPAYFRNMAAVNIFVILLFILCYGYRFYRSMKPIAEGIEKLSSKEPVRLKEKGMTAELAKKLNLTSKTLEEQSRELARRDEARTEWIAGVSHDIRTPLSLIVGYSDKLSKDDTLSEEAQKMSETIRRQSLIIRQLISDLNLTSKLAYHAQPLKKSKCSPAVLLRECAADFYNEGLESRYEIEVIVSEDVERTFITADENLIKRALRNLLGNSIRHNPQGCRVTAVLTQQKDKISYLIEDTGNGIPENVVDNIEKQESEIHIMGLRLTAQIAKAHGGKLDFSKRKEGGYDARLLIESANGYRAFDD